MKESTRTIFVRPTFVRPTFVIIILLALAVASYGQKRPKSIDEGEVKETKRAATFKRTVKVSTRATKATNSVLIVRTEPAEAEVKIDGEPVRSATAGEFRKELPAGKQYTVSVSAGPGYGAEERQVKLIAGRPEIVDVDLTSKYGRAKFGPPIEGAKVLIDEKPLAPGKYKIDAANSQVIIDNIPPGEHTITYDHPDYVIVEKRLRVSAGSEYSWTFLPKRATVELTVRTLPGTNVYVDDRQIGETPDNGVLRYGDIRVGEHEIKLSKNGYEEFNRRLNFEYGKPVELKPELSPRATSAEFSEDFGINLNKWTVPPGGWAIKAGRLELANSAKLGFANNYNYRNFSMQFHLKLTNAGGAAWALRVKDSNDYYLFYLSGPDGLFPGRFNSYIVKDGKVNLQNPTYSFPALVPFSAGGQYAIEITVTNNRIEHKITPSATGEAVPLAVFTDPANLFPVGSIGFRTVANEVFSVDEIVVIPR
jgi:hypothetical protein